MSKLKAGLVGCGNISDIYLKNSAAFKAFDIVACADVDLERAKVKALTIHTNSVYSDSAHGGTRCRFCAESNPSFCPCGSGAAQLGSWETCVQ